MSSSTHAHTTTAAATPGAAGFGGRLILVRHGQTYGNVARALDTALPGQPLTPEGQSQARAVGRALADIVTQGGPVALFTSEAVRAQQTGLLLAEGLRAGGAAAPRVLSLPGIKEIAAGDWEGNTDEPSMVGYIDVVRAWMAGNHEPVIPGGETYEEFVGRWAPLFGSLAAKLAPGGVWDGRDVVVVSHGAAIRTITAAMTIIDPQLMSNSMIRNCGFIALRPPTAATTRWFIEGWDKVSFIAEDGTAGG
ncbi:histidine phosphatase family protein [Corynebacterium sp. 13CS0277]|uniref:histidine phosphatase family protein n=1 Tax=Corynebacterium sp. 13CS0277 TaxID=2071994 RepID=UPI000D032B6D|nr:histidine phosphatase family protein [Corynebacterium sp. 13CS0277]PRQ10495.1 histidine phosphatase family protein [Corynebacterium sp. 13CS0277]